MEIATITSKKQLTLPSKLFKKAGLHIGQKVVVSEEEGKLMITPAQDLVEDLAGSLSIPKRFEGKSPEEIIELAKKEYFQ